ncbi:putative transposase [Vogesella perlucida]|nr:putative transposase [Vogesella perlucida]
MLYRRSALAGGTWFFTVNLADRREDYLTRHIDVLRQAVRQTRSHHPFEIIAMVVLPDHLHAIWALPPGDADYPLRWALIKSAFSRSLPKTECIRDSRLAKRERGIWQRRYWEHQIRDEADLQAHVDYLHFNPVNARLCPVRSRLAVFEFSPLRTSGFIAGRLGGRSGDGGFG